MSEPDPRAIIARAICCPLRIDGECSYVGIGRPGWCRQDIFRSQVDRILSDLETAGFLVVPKEPTPNMVGAGAVKKNEHKLLRTRFQASVADIYRAMIGAAEGTPG